MKILKMYVILAFISATEQAFSNPFFFDPRLTVSHRCHDGFFFSYLSSRLETIRNEIYGEITGLRSEISTIKEDMKELSSQLQELTISKRKQQREKIPSDLSVS